jgi:hypothetical protein
MIASSPKLLHSSAALIYLGTDDVIGSVSEQTLNKGQQTLRAQFIMASCMSSGHESRVGRQSQDRESPRAHRAAEHAHAGQRGHRVTDAFISRDSCTLPVLRCTEVSQQMSQLGQ